MKNFLRYFLQGLVVLVPGAITFLILYKAFNWIRSLFLKFDVIVNPYADPVIIILLVIIAVFLIGLIASNTISRIFIDEAGKMIEKIPFIKHIYSPVKDFTSAFIGNKKRFDRPVFVLTNKEANIREIGFVTSDDLQELGLGKEFVAVYMPMSYAISGRLLIVPSENVKALDIPASEAMKFIVSGGVSEVDE